ncbi:hypothetical protein Z043_115560, partial [Scleropages formosus]
MGNKQHRELKFVSVSWESAPVVLDPNTTHPRLILSEDLTCVRSSDKSQQLPDNPERFNTRPCVLGSEEFSSGKHSWDVEVGEASTWGLGVVTESIRRKGTVEMSPSAGKWYLEQHHGNYTAMTAPRTHLTVRRKPQKIRVQLDWDRGELSFSDPNDSSLLYTFKHRFTEKVFPVFR